MRINWPRTALVAGLAALIAALALRPPMPKGPGGDRSPAAFSALAALADVKAIAERPHPIGSPRQGSVRAYLLARMAALGLQPQIRPFAAPQGPAANLLGVLPGADRTAPAVLLMAHYDSVPAGPGAADDGAGVAAVLETVRALKLSGGLKRDVMVLLTDGEEAGLVGSHAFFTSDPQAAHVGVAINLEARGDRGRAVMFETGPHAGAMIALLLHAHALTGASALMPDLYRRLPNDTDLTNAIRTGHTGLNFALFAGLDAYHRPTDTPRRLDAGSLQSIGDQVLAAARTLARAPALPAPAPDRVYGDLLGGPVLAYPAWAGWLVLAAAAALLGGASGKALKRGPASLPGLAGGGLALLALAAALAGAFWLAGELRLLAAAGHLAPLLRHDAADLAGLAGLGAGSALIWLSAARAGLGRASLWLGALGGLLVLAGVLQALAPADAFILAWPLLLYALAAALGQTTGGRRAVPLIALLAAAQTLYWCGLLFELVGQTIPVALTPLAMLAVLALPPLAPAPGRRTLLAGAGLAGLGLALDLISLAA